MHKRIIAVEKLIQLQEQNMPRWLSISGLFALLWGSIISFYLLYFSGLGGLFNGSLKNACPNDLLYFFLPSARYIVAGHPFLMYSVRGLTYKLYANANGPLGEFFIAGALAIGRFLGLQNIGPACSLLPQYPMPGDSVALRIWFTCIFGSAVIGIAYELLRLSDQFRLRPFTGLRRRFIWFVILFTPPLWNGLIIYGHTEQVLAIWFGLIGVRKFAERHWILSGILIGGALLERSSAFMIVIPLMLVLIRDRRWREGFTWLLSFGVTILILLGPFLIFSYHDTIYSLATFHSQLPIGSGTIWTVFLITPLASHAQSLDSLVAVGLAVGICGWLLWRTGIKADESAFYAIICLSTTCFVLVIKATWGYYFTEPLFWGLAWVLCCRSRSLGIWDYLAIPMFFTGMMSINEAPFEWKSITLSVTEGICMTLMLGLFMMIVISMVIRSKQATERVGALVAYHSARKSPGMTHKESSLKL
jgi:hypothetical protein